MANGLNAKVEIVEKADGADTLAVLIFAWEKKQFSTVNDLPDNLSDDLKSLAQAGMITGKLGPASIHLTSESPKRKLIVIGLGEREKASVENYRVAGGALAKLVRKHQLRSVTVLNAAQPAAVVSGFILGGFEYTDYKGTASKSDNRTAPVTLRMAGKYSVAQQTAIKQSAIIAQSQNYARTIATRPPNDINPPSLAKVAEQLAKEVGLKITVLDEKKMKQLGMGGILAVGAGSNTTPPRMIVLDYAGSSSKKAKTAPLLVVGKAITFDTGGISIKPAVGMERMVFDKCGGMAVLGLMRAVALLKLPVRVVGILAAAENHISETAYRPGDILKMYNGITVEVISTDAEGRLVLGDALSWGIETYKPAAVLDIATLTGGVVVALGKTMAGVMSNNDAIVETLQKAADTAGEQIWRLPIGDDQRNLLKSSSADICNSGPKFASPLLGGAFISYFVPTDTPWAHIDIAGVATTDTDHPYYRKGATGWGVRTLVEWVTSRSA